MMYSENINKQRERSHLEQEGNSRYSRSKTGDSSNFNKQWEEAYLFVEHADTAKCLVCLKPLRNLKKFNLQRHYLTHHVRDYEHLEGAERVAAVENLKRSFELSLEKEDIELSNPEDENEAKENEPKEPPDKKYKLWCQQLGQVSEAISQLQNLAANVTAYDDDCDIFGRHVAAQLRKLSPEQNAIAEEQIQMVITRCRLSDIRTQTSPFSSGPAQTSTVPVPTSEVTSHYSSPSSSSEAFLPTESIPEVNVGEHSH